MVEFIRMKVVISIKQIYQNHLEPMDHLVLSLEVVLAVWGSICLGLNAVTFRYSGTQFFSFHWLLWTPVFFFCLLFSQVWKKLTPKYWFLLRSYCLYALAIISVLILLDGIQFTPFPTIDKFLAHTDSSLRINEQTMVNWSFAHPFLIQILKLAYHSVTVQWLLMPLLLFICRQHNQFNLYLTASLLALLLGSVVYYFFPSLGPTTLYIKTPEFMPATFEEAVMVFPLFHIMLSIINIILWRKTFIGFFIPVLFINSTAVFATLLLGWNYGVHILLGVIMAFFAIYFARKLLVPKSNAYLTMVNFGGPFGRGSSPSSGSPNFSELSS